MNHARIKLIGASARGFTMIELMVTIGLIGVLLSITLPALRSTRDAGREIVCVANLKGLGLTMQAYTQSHHGRYPFVPNDEDLKYTSDGVTFYPASPDGDRSFGVTMSTWGLRSGWPRLMHKVAPWREHFDSWVCPGAERGPGGPWDGTGVSVGFGHSSYAYSTSFVASPSLWSGHSQADESLIRPILISEVTHPSNKVLMWDDEMAHLSARSSSALDHRPMLFADGHAAVMRLSDATEPVANPFTGASERLADTPFGVDGADY